jgi:2-desacetyl-2-hydroxyethyl bacteriochlorophyllide A dehydrogenase
MSQALVYRGPNDLRLEQRTVGAPAPGEVLLRVRACGICGTDLKIARGEHRAYAPGTVRVPGHEIVADVDRVGDGVTAVSPGERVFVAPNIGCGACRQCAGGRTNLCLQAQAFGITRDGGFAEYMAVPALAVEQGVLIKLPAAADAVRLSLIEPLASVVRGARAVALGDDDVVVICGAGPIGLLHVLVARARRAGRVIVSEPSAFRRDEALALGADLAVHPDELTQALRDETGGDGADVVITAVPSAAVQEAALQLTAVGGRINFFAGLPAGGAQIGIDSNLIHYRELAVTGTAANTTEDCRDALALVLSGAISLDRLAAVTVPLDRAREAFDTAAGGQALKVVLAP